jgi:DNA polymerase-3 subunit delta
LTEERLFDRLRDAPLQKVYLFHGKETYFVDRCLEIIRQRILPSPDLADVLSHVFYGSETSVDELLTVARTPPFFQEKQLVLVREADKLKDPGWKKMIAYVEQPSEASCVVFLAGEKLPKNPFFTALTKRGPDACLGFPALKKGQKRKWVERIAREKGVKNRLSEELLAGFLDEGYVPLLSIENRLEMLSLYRQGESPQEDQDRLPPEWVGGALEKGFVFTDVLLRGEESEALILLHRFLEQGTSPVLLLSRIAWEIRRIQQLQEARRRGQSSEDVIRSTGIPVFKKNDYLSLAGRIPEHVIERICFRLLETERFLKSGSRSNLQWHLEDLCIRIAGSMRGR